MTPARAAMLMPGIVPASSIRGNKWAWRLQGAAGLTLVRPRRHVNIGEKCRELCSIEALGGDVRCGDARACLKLVLSSVRQASASASRDLHKGRKPISVIIAAAANMRSQSQGVGRPVARRGGV